MPSVHEPALRIDIDAPPSGPPVSWDEHYQDAAGANLNEAIENALRDRRIALALEHRDLDSTIALLATASTCDELLLTRLKKRRLHLKDEITRIDAFFPA